MRHDLLVAVTILPMRSWMVSWLERLRTQPGGFDALLVMWKAQTEAQKPFFDAEMMDLRETLVSCAAGGRKGVSDALFLYLEPNVKYRGAWLCEKHGWPDLGRRGEEWLAASPDAKLETVDLIHLGCLGKLSKDEWKVLRDFAGRCSFSTYLFCVVRTSRIDLVRKVYGTAGRKAFQIAASMGEPGVALFRMVHGQAMTPDKARTELLHTRNIELSAEAVAEMLDRMGETRRHGLYPDAPEVVYRFDAEGRQTGCEQVDSSPSAEDLLACDSPIPLAVIDKLRLNGTQRYLLKLRFSGPDHRPMPAREISKIMGKGYSPETVRTMLQEILEQVRAGLAATPVLNEVALPENRPRCPSSTVPAVCADEVSR